MTNYYNDDKTRMVNDETVFGVAIYKLDEQMGDTTTLVFRMVANVPGLETAQRWLDGEPLDNLEHIVATYRDD